MRSPLPRRKVPGLITQNIDNLQDSGIDAADAVEHHLCPVPRLQRSGAPVGCGRNSRANSQHAPIAPAAPPIKTGTISFGQAMPAVAEQAEQLSSRMKRSFLVPSLLQLVASPPPALPLMAKRETHIQPRADQVADDVADLVVHHGVGDVLTASIAGWIRVSLRCAPGLCARARVARAGVCFDSTERFVEAPTRRPTTTRRRAASWQYEQDESKMSGTTSQEAPESPTSRQPLSSKWL